MQLRIRHETTYRYAETVRYTIQALRLTPRREIRQHVVSWSMQAPGRRVEQIDAHGNVVHYLTMETPHRELKVPVSGVVETDETAGQPNGELPQLSPLAYQPATALTGADESLASFAREQFRGVDPRELALSGAAAVGRVVRYRPGVTQVTDTATTAFQRGEGVCQDQTQVFLACCRVLGLPARYVSGYLLDEQGSGVASHAWAEVWMPQDECWFGIDVTHGLPVGGRHCRLAVGRDYLDAAPVRGMRRGGGDEQLHVKVDVSRSAQQ